MERSWFINGQPSLFYLSSARAAARREGEGGKPCELPRIFSSISWVPPAASAAAFPEGPFGRLMVASRENSVGEAKQAEQQMPGAAGAPSPGSAIPAGPGWGGAAPGSHPPSWVEIYPLPAP